MSQYAAIPPDAAARVLKEAQARPIERAVIELVLRAGLRGDEVLGLARRHFTPVVNRPKLLVISKHCPPRTIAVAPQVGEAVSALLRKSEGDLNAPIVPLSQQALVRTARDVCRRADVDAGVHDLRKTAIRAVLNADMEITAIDVEAYFGVVLAGGVPRRVRPWRDVAVARVMAGAY